MAKVPKDEGPITVEEFMRMAQEASERPKVDLAQILAGCIAVLLAVFVGVPLIFVMIYGLGWGWFHIFETFNPTHPAVARADHVTYFLCGGLTVAALEMARRTKNMLTGLLRREDRDSD